MAPERVPPKPTNSQEFRNRCGSMDSKEIVQHGDNSISGVTPSAPIPLQKMLSEALTHLEGDDTATSSNNKLDPTEFDEVDFNEIPPIGSPKKQGSIGEIMRLLALDIEKPRPESVVEVPQSSEEREEFLDIEISSIKVNAAAGGNNKPLSSQDCLYFNQGAMCTAYLGKYNNTQVIIKTVQPDCKHYSIAVNDIEVEMLLLKTLRHPNIVTFRGAGFVDQNRFLVLEYLPGDTLTKWIYGAKERPLMKVLDIAIGVCSALSYLHDQAIPGRIVIHRDLKPDNLVFSSNDTIKIIDFGLGKVIKRAYRVKSAMYKMTGGTGSLRYMAPEVASHREYNEKVDVYSLCLILWEMLVCTKPFHSLKRADFYERVIDRAERPDLSILQCPEALIILMKKSWHHDPHVRHSAREMLATLQVIAEEENQRYFIENNQLGIDVIDEAESISSMNSGTNSQSTLRSGYGRKSSSRDLSQIQDFLVKERDYIPKYRLSRTDFLNHGGSSNSTASFSTTSDYELFTHNSTGSVEISPKIRS